MKVSKYNFTFPLREDVYLIYNALSGAFAKVDSDILKLLANMEKGKNIDTDDIEVFQMLDNLKEGKFAIPDDFDETAFLKVVTNVKRFESRVLGLTITPTLECNFACIYCYENHMNVTMNTETITALKDFLQRQTKDISGLGVAWFGGEPLLALNIMEDISGCIFDLQKEEEFHYESGIVTNGYLLDKKKAEKLVELKITKVQITVDGPQGIHDVRRPLRNRKGTFKRIMKNLVDISDILKSISIWVSGGCVMDNVNISDILKSISIRVNVDASNVDRVPELFDILKSQGLKEKVGVYFSPVQIFSKVCRDISPDCLSHEVFSKYEINLFKITVEKGFKIWKYPRPLHGYCGAVNYNSLVVDPYGDFHKCWNTVGIKSEAVGTLGEPLEMNSLLTEWLSWDPFENEECRACRFLPICMGGCPYLLRTKERNCDPWKYNLEEMLQLYYATKPKSEMPST